MRLAIDIARRSHSERNQVGAVIVDGDNTSVLGIGYNGIEAGGPNEVDSNEPGKEGTIHAEANALLKFNFRDPCVKKMYVTLSPCVVCARMIVNAGISEVIYKDAYRDDSGLALLEARGIGVYKWVELKDTPSSFSF